MRQFVAAVAPRRDDVFQRLTCINPAGATNAPGCCRFNLLALRGNGSRLRPETILATSLAPPVVPAAEATPGAGTPPSDIWRSRSCGVPAPDDDEP